MNKYIIKGKTGLLPKNYGKDFLFAILCCAIAILTIIEPIVLSKLIDAATYGSGSIKRWMVLFVILVFVVRVVFTCCKKISLTRYRNECISHLSNTMVNHLLRAKTTCYDEWSASYMTSRVIDELSNINGILPRFLLDGILSIIICVVIFGLMIRQSALIGLLTLIFVIADYIVAFKLPLTKVYKQANETMANTKSHTNNLFQGYIQVKMGDGYDKEVSVHDATLKETLNVLFKKSIFTQLQSLTNSACRQFGYLLVIVLSAIFISEARISLAQFTMLISLYNLFWNHVIISENVIPLYKYGKVTMSRIREVLEKEVENSIEITDRNKHIATVNFNNVAFAYNREQKVLKNLSFSVKTGEIISLAGYSGCGKSTALKILLGFIERDSGEVLLNGQIVNADELVSLRERIGYISQQSFLFNRSIRENLLYYVDDEKETESKVLEYIRLFGLEELISSLPEGLNHILTNNSNTISGGEQQRLCVIRELMKKPDILILDECTSSLDPETERRIFAVLKALADSMVVIQVAHRPSALAYSDMVYVIDDGCVIESGRHSDLIKTSSFYKKLLATLHDEG